MACWKHCWTRWPRAIGGCGPGLLLLLALLAGAAMSAGAQDFGDTVEVGRGAAERVEGSGKARTAVRQVPPFTRIVLSLPGKLVVEQAPGDSLTLTADDNLHDLIATEVRQGVLHIEVAPGRRFAARRQGLHVRVEARTLAKLTVAGAGNAEVSQPDGNTLEVEIAGSGNIDVSGSFERVATRISGSGNVRLRGRATEVDLVLGGAGNIGAADLAGDRVSVSIAGAGSIAVNARTKLDVSISGAGTVGYRGNPQVSERISGAGSIRRIP